MVFKWFSLVYGIYATLFQQYMFVYKLFRGGQFYWSSKPEYPEKNKDLPQVTDKLSSHNVVSSTPRHERCSKTQIQW